MMNNFCSDSLSWLNMSSIFVFFTDVSTDSDETGSDETESSGMLLLKSGKSSAGPKTESPTSNNTVKSKTATRKLMSLKENSPMVFNQEGGLSPLKGYTCSPLFLQVSNRRNVRKRNERGQKRKDLESGEEWEEDSRVAKMSKPSQSVSSESPVPTKQTVLTDYSMADVVRSGPCMRKSCRKTITAVGSAERERDCVETRAEGRTTRRQSCGNLTVTPISRHKTASDLCSYKDNVKDEPIIPSPCAKPAHRQSTDATSTVNAIGSFTTELTSQTVKTAISSDCDISCQPVVPQKGNNGSLLGLSMSVAYHDSLLSSSSSLAPPRPSIDEFQLAKKRLKHRGAGASQSKVRSRHTPSTRHHGDVDSGNSSGSGSCKADFQFVKPDLVDEEGKQRLDSLPSGNTSDKSSEGSDGEKTQMGAHYCPEKRKVTKKNDQKPKSSIVMTSLHTP